MVLKKNTSPVCSKTVGEKKTGKNGQKKSVLFSKIRILFSK